MINDCEQLNIDNKWSTTRKNACHISNQNEEMGDIRTEIVGINLKINTIQNYQAVNVWFWGAIGLAIISLVIKKMFGK